MLFERLTYAGPPIDDPGLLDELPRDLRSLLRQANGFVAYGGALHVRGACLAPDWHALRTAWQGAAAIASCYRSVFTADVPFAQDALGDQYLLRDGAVWHLKAEIDESELFADSLPEFLEQVSAAPLDYLVLGPLQDFWDQDGHLQPGELLSVYPPLIMRANPSTYSYRAIPAADRLAFLASFAAQVRDLPDGTSVKFVINDD
jgi:hypothetical protein